jgi:putative tryptophan/tyrosine transport system substrate-binding protein
MRRIGLAIIFALSLTLAPIAAEAQQPPRVARVGWMSLATPTAPALNFDVFRQGLRDLGYVEGQNLILEPRYTGGKNDLLPELIADLERVGVDIIVAGPFAALRVAKQTTTRIPIVMTPSAGLGSTGVAVPEPPERARERGVRDEALSSGLPRSGGPRYPCAI